MVTEEAIKKISLAYHLDSANSMVGSTSSGRLWHFQPLSNPLHLTLLHTSLPQVLNHLADHYFWAWIPVKKVVVVT